MNRTSTSKGQAAKASAKATPAAPKSARSARPAAASAKASPKAKPAAPVSPPGRKKSAPANEGTSTMQHSTDQLIGILRDTVVALVRRDGPDLSARQLGVFLTVYLNEGPHTVRGLAAELHVSKPAITRALDRLGELDLARRKVDPMDRRSVLVQRTLKGAAFLRDTRSIMASAEQQMVAAAA